jgi:prevent-host-death family protein
MATWGLAEAKAKFSEVVERAERHEPQEISRNGKAVVLIVSLEDWNARATAPMLPPAKGKSAWDLMRPAKGDLVDDFVVERDKRPARVAQF